MPLTAGARLGSYEIMALLGSGGMGEVYRARDAKLGREVAIKVLPADVGRPDALARFEHEARSVASLSHPNILAIHDFGSADGIAFAVTELLDGQTLRDAIAAGPLPARRATAFAAAIARGLAAAHDKGIVHRDLKPENIFVTRDDRIKILDFGLARQEPVAAPAVTGITMPSPTEPGTVLGTVGYMAPEQVRGENADWRADIFAFGAVLFEMLTGRRAFQKETAAETMTAILRDDLPDDATASMPAALDRIVRHCLEKKPDARFHSTHDLAFALDAVSGATTASGKLTAIEAAGADGGARRARTTRWIAAAALVAGLTIGAASVWIASGQRAAAPASEPPTFRQVTFGRELVFGGRFAPDGRTIVYSAGRQAKRLFLSRLESTGSTPLAVEDMRLLAVSANAELALVDAPRQLSLTAPGTLAQAPMIGGTPRSVLADVTFADWSPRGDALAVVRVLGSHQRLEFPVGTVLYETDGEIGYPRVAPSGDRVAFLDWPVKSDDRGTVALVDLHGAKQTLSQTWEAISGLAWDPDGTQIWYSAAHSGMRYAIWTTAPGRPERRIYAAPAGLTIQDISRDGRVLVNQIGGSIRGVTWHAGDAAVRDISWTDFLYVRDISPDGTRLLLTTSGEGTSPNYDVFVCAIDGTGATRIGEGQAQQFSPDGKFALSMVHGPPVRLMILPLGTGDARTVATGDVTPVSARWLRDGRQLLIAGTQPGKGARAFVIDLDGSAPRPVSPEGISYASEKLALSPDDRRVALRSPEGQVMMYSLTGGPPEAVKGLKPDEMPIDWTADGRALILPDGIPATMSHLLRLDPVTGDRRVLIEIKRSDPTVDIVSSVLLSADASVYAATFQRVEGTLFVVDGLMSKK